MSKIAKSMAVLGVVAGLGVAALPLGSYAAESAPVTIRATVDSSIAVTATDTLVDLGTVNPGAGTATQTTSVTVSGSVTTYNLGVMDQDTDTNMNWVNDGGLAPVGSGTPAKIIQAKGGATLSGGWGFRVDKGVNVAADNWTAMPAYNADGVDNLVQSGTLDKDNGSTTNVEFGVNVDGLTLENGVYEDVVVFTATSAS